MRPVITSLTGLAALAVLAGFGGRWVPVLDLVAAFRPHLAVLGAAVAVAAALGRQWRAAGLAAGVAVLAGATLGPALESPERAGEGKPLTLLYGNVREANPGAAALATSLLAHEADVLVTSETPRALAERLAGHYPHRLVTAAPGGTKRTAIWSRFPLREGRLYLNNTVAPTGASAVIGLGEGREIGLIGAHLSRPTEAVQPRQVAGLEEIAGGLPRPLVIVGDFNAAPWSATLGRAARLTGTRIAGGWRITWRGAYETLLGPLPEPWGHQIDHLLLSQGVGLETIEAVPLPGSDHAGLRARLRIPAADPQGR